MGVKGSNPFYSSNERKSLYHCLHCFRSSNGYSVRGLRQNIIGSSIGYNGASKTPEEGSIPSDPAKLLSLASKRSRGFTFVKVMKRSAAILVDEEYNVLGHRASKKVWKIINNPTIGDIHSLRQKGAIIMRQIIERHGNEIHKYWVTDSGRALTHTTEYLSYEQLRSLNNGSQ